MSGIAGHCKVRQSSGRAAPQRWHTHPKDLFQKNATARSKSAKVGDNEIFRGSLSRSLSLSHSHRHKYTNTHTHTDTRTATYTNTQTHSFTHLRECLIESIVTQGHGTDPGLRRNERRVEVGHKPAAAGGCHSAIRLALRFGLGLGLVLAPCCFTSSSAVDFRFQTEVIARCKRIGG